MTPWQFLGLCGFSVMFILGAYGSFWAARQKPDYGREWTRAANIGGWVYLAMGIIGLVIGLGGLVVTAIW